MKTVLSISLHPEKHKRIIDYLNSQSNISETVRLAVEAYMDNQITDESVKKMLTDIKAQLGQLAQKGPMYIQSPVAGEPSPNKLGKSATGSMKLRIEESKKTDGQQAIDESDPELEEAIAAMDNLGKKWKEK